MGLGAIAIKAPATKKASEPPINDVPADFETAMDVAGFGTFHILLVMCALPAGVSNAVDTSIISYILPSAECDLKLTLLDKGYLNGITFAGMISSALLWGYIADTKGRKKVLVFGYLGSIISTLGAACSQNVTHLMIFKYASGFILCGPFAVLLSYLTELHGKKQRARVVMWVGLMFSVGYLWLPLVALVILPSHWDFQLFGLQFHSWQIYLATGAIPCLIGSILLSFFPESPKFLMSQGRNAEALRVFQTIYAINNRKSREDYPIKELINELMCSDKASDASTASVATIEEALPKEMESTASKLPAKEKKPTVGFRQGLEQLRPMLTKPYFGLSIRVYLINFAMLLGQITLRLWLPQMFASSEEYEQIHGTGGSTMCTILAYSVNKTQTQITDISRIEKCEVVITAASYTNNITVAVAVFVGSILAGFIVNRIGSKMLFTISTFTAGCCAVGLYYATSALNISIIAAIAVPMGSISTMSLLSSLIDIFPTSLRTTIVSLTMMFGRLGSIFGNILFPIFMSLGCAPPFIMLAFVMWFAVIISATLPHTKKTVLK